MNIELKMQAKQRILDKLDAYIAKCESDPRYFMQVNRNHAYTVREEFEALSLTQAFKIEQAVSELENRPRNSNPLLDFGPVVVSPTDYLQFLDR